MRAVILAGGKGHRLRPYTAVLPKPLVPLGDRPILEIVIAQLRQAGVTRLTLAVGHLAGLIQAYFGDGQRFGVEIDYGIETTPLGTAGPLAMLDGVEDDFLVMNGDVLCDLDFGAFVRAHREGGGIATIATYQKSVDITLGVLTVDERGDVQAYDEKPSRHYLVSTGIYCFRPDVIGHLHRGEPCDLPVLVRRLIGRGERVATHLFSGYWLDIGRPEDYEAAIDAFTSQRVSVPVPLGSEVPKEAGVSDG